MSDDKQKSIDVRAVLTGSNAEEYLYLKELLGTAREPETVRIIIHRYYELVKKEGKLL